MLTQHAKVNTKKSLMSVMSSCCIRIAKVKLNLCIRTVSSGSSLDCSCLFMYSMVSVNLSGQRSWSDWMMIKCWYIYVIPCCLLQIYIKKEERKNTMFTQNILTPYHVCPKKSLRSFIYLFIHLKLPDERHSVTTLIIPRSTLGPHCSDFEYIQ